MTLKKGIVALVLLAWSAVLHLDAADTGEKTVRFALTGTASIGRVFDGELGVWLAPGARVDFGLGRDLAFTTEVLWITGWQSVAAACSLNVRIGSWANIGAGPLVTWATPDGTAALAFKAHFGWTADHYLFEFHYVMAGPPRPGWGNSPRLIGLTIGYVF